MVKVNNDGYVEVSNLIPAIIKGILIGIMSIIIISFIPSILINYNLVQTDKIKVISIVVLFIGSLIGGYMSAIKYGRNGMVVGILTSLFLLGIIILIGLLLQTISFEMVDISLFLVKLFGLMLFGAVGGILGINMVN